MLTAMLFASLLSSIGPTLDRMQEGFDNPTPPPPAEETIHHVADTGFAYTAVLGGDLISTQVCIRANPRCEEKNPLLWNSDVALASKGVILGAVCWADYKLFVKHPRAARKLRRLVVIAGAGLIASNLVTAYGR